MESELHSPPVSDSDRRTEGEIISRRLSAGWKLFLQRLLGKHSTLRLVHNSAWNKLIRFCFKKESDFIYCTKKMYHVRKYKKSLALNQDNIYREKFSGFRMVSKNNMEV